ncbi:MAG: competence/damage-inducible protein A [Candidatus Sericytochromatia bacterium]|nr:competence/damage-inducible protein A [Candidatus Sericytochromatia bacterium]
MKAEVICIGTELLLGDIVNTNASFFAKELASIGISLHYITTIGDNKERIISAFKLAFERADIIITSGGLGPTVDDITHECIADFLSVKQDLHQDIADKLQAFFKDRGREMVKSNLKQAYLPSGTDILTNNYGTAPGLIYNKNGKIILTFPGVPKELKSMWSETAKPYLFNLQPNKSLIKSRDLRFAGEGESAIAEKVSDLLALENPTVAPYAGNGEVRLRITAKAESEEKADSLIKPIEEEIRKRFPKFYYGSDSENLASVVGKLLIEKKQTLSVAESFTGGTVAKRIVDNTGASNYFTFGMVAYSEELKIKLLGIEKELINTYSIYSEQVAVEMAKKVREMTGTDWGIGTTGLADNIDKDNVKAGTIFVAINSKEKTEVRKLVYSGWKREDIIYMGSQAALNLLRLALIE